jgi:multidrug efflux system membrane fusion protein
LDFFLSLEMDRGGISMTNSFRWAFASVSIVLAASATAVFVLSEPLIGHATAVVEPQAAQPVKVATVSRQDIRLWEDFSGRLEAIDRVDIRARVSGAITSVHFREGSLVKAGDLLFTVDPEPYRVTVQHAEGEVALADAKVHLAQTELDRGLKLSGSNAISLSDLDQRRSTLDEAQAGLRSAQANLLSAQIDLGYSQVRAPVAGRVGKIDVTVGNLVAAGAESSILAKLVSVDPIYASFDASEKSVATALSKLPATPGNILPIEQIPIQAGTLTDSGTPLKGTVQLVDNEVNAASGTITVRAVFPNPNGILIPGQFVRVRMGEPMPEARVLIPERAVATDQDHKYVYVVDDQNKVSYRTVTLGGFVGGLRIVTDGLSPGERIVVSGLQLVRPNGLVAPTLEEQDATIE